MVDPLSTEQLDKLEKVIENLNVPLQFDIINIDTDDFDDDAMTGGERIGQVQAPNPELAYLGMCEFADEHKLAIETLMLRAV